MKTMNIIVVSIFIVLLCGLFWQCSEPGDRSGIDSQISSLQAGAVLSEWNKKSYLEGI